MKIAILDEYDANFDSIAGRDFLECFGEVLHWKKTAPEELLEHISDADAVITNKTVITAETISRIPSVKYIGIIATGTNVVDLDAAHKAGIAVTNVPSYSTSSVAQLIFAHLLNVEREVEKHAQSDWRNAVTFSYSLTPQYELDSSTLGLVGFGEIGRAAAKIALACNMNVVTFTRTPSKAADMPQVKCVSFDELLGMSDVIAMCCPLTESNRRMINAEAISKMKRSAIFINTARGGLVDEYALAEALKKNQIRAACLDTLTCEPPEQENPLLCLPNARITPHYAWATVQARKRLWDAAKRNIESYLAGGTLNRV